jgi:hypothetical protein
LLKWNENIQKDHCFTWVIFVGNKLNLEKAKVIFKKCRLSDDSYISSYKIFEGIPVNVKEAIKLTV